MRIVFTGHAEKRRKQRGFTTIEIEFILERPKYKINHLTGRIEVGGNIRNRKIRIIYEKEKNYINIITLR